MANARAFSATMLSLGLLQKTHSMCGMCDSCEVGVSFGTQFTGARPLNDDFIEVFPPTNLACVASASVYVEPRRLGDG